MCPRFDSWWHHQQNSEMLHYQAFRSFFRFSHYTIAQLVEQRTENPCVPGSIPGGTTSKTPKCFIIKHFGVFFVLVTTPNSHYKSHYLNPENPCVPGSIPGGTTSKTPKCFIIKHFGVFFVLVTTPNSHYKSHYLNPSKPA